MIDPIYDKIAWWWGFAGGFVLSAAIASALPHLPVLSDAVAVTLGAALPYATAMLCQKVLCE